MMKPLATITKICGNRYIIDGVRPCTRPDAPAGGFESYTLARFDGKYYKTFSGALRALNRAGFDLFDRSDIMPEYD